MELCVEDDSGKVLGARVLGAVGVLFLIPGMIGLVISVIFAIRHPESFEARLPLMPFFLILSLAVVAIGLSCLFFMRKLIKGIQSGQHQ